MTRNTKDAFAAFGAAVGCLALALALWGGVIWIVAAAIRWVAS